MDMKMLELFIYMVDLIWKNMRNGSLKGCLQSKGLKLSLDKCIFYRTSVSYVGHIVSLDSVLTDPSKIEAMKFWPDLKMCLNYSLFWVLWLL